jgi:hypothetical protein
MSAFYDQASLVVVPSGYKSGKIYAQKPLTTDGQLTFTRASTATRVNASGLIEAVASGVPRLDYTNSSCPKLLLEPQRTNLVTYSEQFDNAAWLKTAASITANTSVSPDGYANADTLTEDNTSNLHRTLNYISAVTGSTYTASIFCKAGSGTRNLAILFGCGFGEQEVVFNVNNGTVVQVSNATGTITSYGNGWYRCTATATSQQTTTICVQYQLRDGVNQIYQGNGTSSLIIYGAMAELGAYATSYVKTEAATVTRVADAASKTGISSLIGQTEGTLFVELVWKGHIAAFQSIEIFGNSNNRIGIYSYDATNTFRWFVFGNGLLPFENNITSALVIGQRYKIAIAYKSGASVAYVNGTQTFSSSATFTFNNALNDLYYRLGSGVDPLFQPISQNLLFKTRLTNAQLAELTTL